MARILPLRAEKVTSSKICRPVQHTGNLRCLKCILRLGEKCPAHLESGRLEGAQPHDRQLPLCQAKRLAAAVNGGDLSIFHKYQPVKGVADIMKAVL